ncbi:hypothetical protein N7492_006972 [Penicillium capsulatum]|uniref:Phosphoglycerate mutase family protein n=1 Tax=Penicillium capsulatum TaxID=69766 RepID=A0A9W9I2Q0_9EURO|nr:hypothetical protein N7492_006972 [Penicillium capsulatum]KAJ6116805.1 hypothetical protein N7512_006530 [Penicillium capsulatum]
MKLFLIRHAETVHNVGQVWAGTTDSALTNHGILQIECLARQFSTTPVYMNTVFSSDLSRARLTAEGICRLQPPTPVGIPLTPILTPDLREKDFGSLEGLRWDSSNVPGDGTARSHGGSASSHIESESTASMRRRMTGFLNAYLLPLLFDAPNSERNVAVVSHGIILRVLWNCLVELIDPMNISIASGVSSWNGGPADLIVPNWSNTGFLNLLLEPQAAEPATHTSPSNSGKSTTTLLHGWSMKILAINSRDHLTNLRRTRGGIGSATHDTRQKRIDHFFKR